MPNLTFPLPDKDSRARLQAFWRRECIGRPAIKVVVTSPWPECPFQHIPIREREMLPEYHAWRIKMGVEHTQYLAEGAPGYHVWWASSLMHLPALVGAHYEYSESHNTVWVVPMERDFLAEEPPRWDPHHWLIKKLDACSDAACAAVAGRGFITPPLLLDPLTTIAQMRTEQQFCMDLLERPEAVNRWARALAEIYAQLYERYYRRAGFGASLCFFNVLAEGRSEGVQCDTAVLLSPEMYDEFVLPDLRKISDYMDMCLYHLDGVEQMRFLEQIKSCPHIKGIQWNPATYGYEPSKHLPLLHRIQDLGLCLHLSCEPHEAVLAARELKPEGLFLTLKGFRSLDEARATVRAIEQAARERWKHI